MAAVSQHHPGVQSFMARRGIAATALRSDGRLTLLIDRHRVHLFPVANGRLVVMAKVMNLPGSGVANREAEAAIERLLNLSAGTLKLYAATLCVEKGTESVKLQQQLDAKIRAIAYADVVDRSEKWFTFNGL